MHVHLFQPESNAYDRVLRTMLTSIVIAMIAGNGVSAAYGLLLVLVITTWGIAQSTRDSIQPIAA